MSSTNKTANLGLNQWAAQDAFSREDLNSDFQAIDKALGGQVVKLADITLEEESASVSIDLSEVDLAGFVELHVFMPVKVNMKPNGFSGTYQYYAGDSWKSGAVNPSFHSGYCIIRNSCGLDGTEGNTVMADNNIFYASASNIGRLRRLAVTKMDSSNFKAGERFLVLGFKI